MATTITAAIDMIKGQPVKLADSSFWLPIEDSTCVEEPGEHASRASYKDYISLGLWTARCEPTTELAWAAYWKEKRERERTAVTTRLYHEAGLTESVTQDELRTLIERQEALVHDAQRTAGHAPRFYGGSWPGEDPRNSPWREYWASPATQEMVRRRDRLEAMVRLRDHLGE